MSRAPHIIAPPPVFRPDWATLARLASRWSKPLDLDAYPASTSLRRFCDATNKPKPVWFWGLNQETATMILRPSWVSNHQTGATDFETRTENHRGDFESQITKPGLSILRSKPKNRRPWFWGSTKKYVLLVSLCIVQIAHGVTRPPIVRPLSTRPILDHHQFSAPGLLLLSRSLSLPTMSHMTPTHH
jgi:hypothetical protein